MADSASTFRLILWPSLITLAISIARTVAEVQGWLTNVSGGRLVPLGITWCIFVFGAWFGRSLARSGSFPRVSRAWLWALLALLAAVGATMWGFRSLQDGDKSEATFQTLRQAVLTTAAVLTVGAVVMFYVWSRLAWTLLVYGLLARGTVVAITWFAKHQGWDTHYTKFGPMGIERDMGDTMVSACVAQFGMWVPFTVVGGMLAGALLARRPAA